MYAIIQTGGKQYRVNEGQVVRFEKLTAEPGSKVNFDQVLMIADGDRLQVGAPLLKGASVSAEVIEQGRGRKIRILKFKRRKNYIRRMGHRQDFTAVKITKIAA